jgi:hypothetical protein
MCKSPPISDFKQSENALNRPLQPKRQATKASCRKRQIGSQGVPKAKGPKQVKAFSINPIEKGENKMMKQWRAPLNKAPSKIGKEEQRPGNPS